MIACFGIEIHRSRLESIEMECRAFPVGDQEGGGAGFRRAIDIDGFLRAESLCDHADRPRSLVHSGSVKMTAGYHDAQSVDPLVERWQCRL